MVATYGKDDKDISVNVENQFHITFPSSMSGGYELHFDIENKSKIRLLKRQSHPSEIGGGTEVFTFQALQPGETLIHFEKKRPWKAKPEATYHLRIHIKKQIDT